VSGGLRECCGDLADRPLNFGRHANPRLGIVVVSDGVEARLVRDVNFLVVSDELIRLAVAQEIEQEVELDLNVLRDRGLLDLKAAMAVSDETDRLRVDADFHMRVRFRVMVAVLRLVGLDLGLLSVHF
jgi:hypothetical protein